MHLELPESELQTMSPVYDRRVEDGLQRHLKPKNSVERKRLEMGMLTGFFVPAGQDIFDHVLPIQSFRSVQQAQGDQSPVNTIKTKVLGHMVGEVIGFLASELMEV